MQPNSEMDLIRNGYEVRGGMKKVSALRTDQVVASAAFFFRLGVSTYVWTRSMRRFPRERALYCWMLMQSYADSLEYPNPLRLWVVEVTHTDGMTPEQMAAFMASMESLEASMEEDDRPLEAPVDTHRSRTLSTSSFSDSTSFVSNHPISVAPSRVTEACLRTLWESTSVCHGRS